MNEKIYPSMVIRSQAEAIELLQQENARLKDKIDKAINLLEDNQFIWSAMDDEILKILKEN